MIQGHFGIIWCSCTRKCAVAVGRRAKMDEHLYLALNLLGSYNYTSLNFYYMGVIGKFKYLEFIRNHGVK